jgi:hypothetical protein
MGSILFALLVAYFILRIAFIFRYRKHEKVRGRK